MESTILLTGMDKAQFKDLLREVLLEILKGAEHEEKNVSEILSAQEAALFLKVKVSTLYEKTSSKSIPHFKKGNKLYFYRTELEQWLMDGKVKTADELQCEAITYTLNKRKRAA